METWDQRTFEAICKRHRLETESPIVFAEMVQFEKKMNKLGVNTVFIFPGYGDVTRFMKSRFGLMQEIPREIALSSKLKNVILKFFGLKGLSTLLIELFRSISRFVRRQVNSLRNNG